jgi:hypothetical protein
MFTQPRQSAASRAALLHERRAPGFKASAARKTIAKNTRPAMRKHVRHPAALMSAPKRGAKAVAPTPTPAIVDPSAIPPPEWFTNHRATVAVHTGTTPPAPTPVANKSSWSWMSDSIRLQSTMEMPVTRAAPRRTGRGEYLSVSQPYAIEDSPRPTARNVNPEDVSPLVQPNSFSRALKKTPNDH